MKINFVYFNSHIVWTKEYLINYYEYHPDNATAAIKNSAIKISAQKENQINAVKAWKEEFDYCFFITVPTQNSYFEAFLKEYNLPLVWKSKQMAVNANYPERGPRLTGWLVKMKDS